jgi:hypothetical protein
MPRQPRPLDKRDNTTFVYQRQLKFMAAVHRMQRYIDQAIQPVDREVAKELGWLLDETVRRAPITWRVKSVAQQRREAEEKKGSRLDAELAAEHRRRLLLGRENASRKITQGAATALAIASVAIDMQLSSIKALLASAADEHEAEEQAAPDPEVWDIDELFDSGSD